MLSTLNLYRNTASNLSSRHWDKNASTFVIFSMGQRRMSWLSRLNAGLRPQHEHFNEQMDNQEEAAKVAILEKAMKGRQPTELKLRCESRSELPSLTAPDMFCDGSAGTVLDAHGQLFNRLSIIHITCSLICGTC
jgi:hypothetical protein